MGDRLADAPEPDANVLDVATRVLRRSGVLHDMRTLGEGLGAFVQGAMEGGLKRGEAKELAMVLVSDLVEAAVHVEASHDDLEGEQFEDGDMV